MFFSKRHSIVTEQDVFFSGRRLQVVSEYKYLGVHIDTNLSFKTHIRKVCNKVKFNLSNFRYIRNFLSTAAAELYLHSMVLSHINYCLISCSEALYSSKATGITL